MHHDSVSGSTDSDSLPLPPPSPYPLLADPFVSRIPFPPYPCQPYPLPAEPALPASRPAVSLSADPTNYKTQGATFLIKFLYKLKHLGFETPTNENSRNLDFSLPHPLPAAPALAA